MNRRKLLGGFSKDSKTAERLDYFQARLEPLEERQLLSAVSWTITQSLSAVTVTIPDQNISLSGFDINVRLRNQSGSNSNPWTTNVTRIAGNFSTDYTDNSSIEFLGGDVLTSVPIYSVRPNPADYQDIGGTTGLFTGTSSAPAALGAKLVANLAGLDNTAGFISMYGMSFDVDSDPMPITASTFPLAGSNFNLSTLSGTLAVDGTSIFLLGQLVPDTIISLTDPFNGTATTGIGTVANLGGANRQLTVPVFVPAEIEFSGQTLHGTVSGQIVATATISTNAAPTIDLGNAPNYSTTWNYAPVATENTATAAVGDD